MKSAYAALSRLVTMPIRSGTEARTSRRLRSSNPSPVRTADEPVAILGEAAQRVGGVDSRHAQVDLATRFVELDPAPDAHLEAVLEPHAVLGEMALDGLGDRSEQRDPQRDAFVADALDQVEVEVARAPTG